MSTDVTTQLHAAATWAEQEAAAERDREPESEPGYELTVRPLRMLARYVAQGDLDMSRLAPPSETEGVYSGLVARLRQIGIDVWEMCGKPEVRA